MTRKEIISGLQFTIDMFLFNPNTGETLTEPRNDMDKTTIDACKGAIELLEQAPTSKNDLGVDCVSRQEVLRLLANSIGKTNTYLQTEVLKMPSVTSREPRKGHWISHRKHCEMNNLRPSGLGSYFWCSECDCGIDSKNFSRVNYNYCPNCGAKMSEEKK